MACGLLLFGCQREPAAEADSASADARSEPVALASSGGARKPTPTVETAVAPYQRELLELAFDAASRFPVNPHRKSRGRAQAKVVAAAFELGQLDLAERFASSVEGWRRGLAYADLAAYEARQGHSNAAREWLRLAGLVVDEVLADPREQRWRVDRVRQKMARALVALGDTKQALELAAEIAPASSSAVDPDWAATMASRLDGMTAAGAGAELARIDNGFVAQALGEQFTSLMLLSSMHDRFFADADLRRAIEERLLDRFDKLPIDMRLDAIAPLVRHYAARGDRDGGRAVLVRMVELCDKVGWRLEDELPERARLAELRAAIGDQDEARRILTAALQRYFEHREELQSFMRCEALRPLALAWAEVGDREQAGDLLVLALEEAAQNPNARPRCDDLVETCVDLAVHGFEPSSALWARLRELRDGLKAPW